MVWILTQMNETFFSHSEVKKKKKTYIFPICQQGKNKQQHL